MTLGQLVANAAAGVGIARHEIRTGRFQRSMSLIVAFSAIVSGWEAYSQHVRGDFASRWMWTPVWLMPPAAAAAGAAAVSPGASRIALPAVSVASLADGVIGFGLHLRGIARMPGGYRLGQYNIVMGPPIFAPLLMASVGVLGLIASALRREDVGDLLAADDGLVERLSAVAASFGTTAADLLESAEAIGRDQDALARVESDVAHGRFQQAMALVAAAFAVLAGGEAYFEHLRGSYNDRLMWTPVWLTPPMVGAALAAVRDAEAARTLLPIASAVTFLDGVLGFGLHLRGIDRMPGGFANLRFNLSYGPPLFAPLLLTSVGLLGLTAALLRRQPSGRQGAGR